MGLYLSIAVILLGAVIFGYATYLLIQRTKVGNGAWGKTTPKIFGLHIVGVMALMSGFFMSGVLSNV